MAMGQMKEMKMDHSKMEGMKMDNSKMSGMDMSQPKDAMKRTVWKGWTYFQSIIMTI
jgi:hypothetical protein